MKQAGAGLLLLLASLGLVPGAQAQQGRDEADKLEAMRDQARKRQQENEKKVERVQGEITDLQGQLISIGREVAHQNNLQVKAEDQLLILELESKEKTRQMLEDHASLQELLAALQRSEMSPPPPLAVTPNDSLAATRAAILLAATVPKLKERAGHLRKLLQELTRLRMDIDIERQALIAKMEQLEGKEQSLQDLLDKRRGLQNQLQTNAQTASRQASLFSEQAQNLRELIRQLEADASRTTPRLKPKRTIPGSRFLAPRLKPGKNTILDLPPVFHAPTARFADFRGALELPVSGMVLHGYGRSPDPDQLSGMVFASVRRSQVLAPSDGRIAFAGNFRNFGKLLILDVGEGYHIVLSGLAASYVVKGQSVLAGEPIGKMQDRRKPIPEFYLEFRKQGQPFDPAPWLKKPAGTG